VFSISQKYPAYAAGCEALREGRSAYSGQAEIPFDVHCYRDGWHIYWKNPPNGIIGRQVHTRELLRSFLDGNWSVGVALRSPDLILIQSSCDENVMKRRFDSHRK
jgi:hypothetical protein